MSDGRQLVLNYRFLSIMFIFQLAFSKKWMIVGRDRAMDQEVDRAELERLYDDDIPDLGLWSQYGLLLAAGAFVVLVIVVGVFS